MKTASRFALLLILVPTAALYSWQQQSQKHSREEGVSPNWPELMACVEKMHGAMGSIERTGNNDVDFVRLMLPHHQGAIDMAKAQLRYGKDPQIRRLAQEIITDQQSEIELMKLWLKQHEPGANRTSAGDVSKER